MTDRLTPEETARHIASLWMNLYFKRAVLEHRNDQLHIKEVVGVPQEAITGEVLRGRGPRRGNLERLLRYWRPIMKKPGGWRRCVVTLADHPELGNIRALCAWLHHETTGKWPNEGNHHGTRRGGGDRSRGRRVARRLARGSKSAANLPLSGDPDLVDYKAFKFLADVSEKRTSVERRLVGLVAINPEEIKPNPVRSIAARAPLAVLGRGGGRTRIGRAVEAGDKIRCPKGYEHGGRYTSRRNPSCGRRIVEHATPSAQRARGSAVSRVRGRVMINRRTRMRRGVRSSASRQLHNLKKGLNEKAAPARQSARGGGNPAVFDPNARDADGDGRLQDGTPFERPARQANEKPKASDKKPSSDKPKEMRKRTGTNTGRGAKPKQPTPKKSPADRFRDAVPKAPQGSNADDGARARQKIQDGFANLFRQANSTGELRDGAQWTNSGSISGRSVIASADGANMGYVHHEPNAGGFFIGLSRRDGRNLERPEWRHFRSQEEVAELFGDRLMSQNVAELGSSEAFETRYVPDVRSMQPYRRGPVDELMDQIQQFDSRAISQEQRRDLIAAMNIHMFDGTFGDGGNLPEMMEVVEAIRERAKEINMDIDVSTLSDGDLEAMKNRFSGPGGREAWTLAYGLARAELALRKLARERARGSYGANEDRNQIAQLLEQLRSSGRI